MFAFPAKKKPYSKKLIAKLWSAVLPNSIVTIHSQNSFLADIFILARLILFVNPYSGFLLFFVRSLLLFPFTPAIRPAFLHSSSDSPGPVPGRCASP